MNKFNKVAALFATVAMAGGAFAQTAQTTVDNWRATDGTVWKNGTNEYCWRDNPWTPATGVKGCDGVPAPAPAPAPAAAPAPAPAAAPTPAPVAAPVAPATEKVSFAADAFFDFDKAVLKPEGKGEKQPVADNKSADGRAKNRRVEIEVVGTRAK